jgi:hypothetical protein
MSRSLWVFGFMVVAAACGTDASRARHPPADSAASEVGGTACKDSSFFTACVHACGETDESEPTAAECVAGYFRCAEPFVPASDCPAGSWTSPRLACGPWPGNYNCGSGCAVCDATQAWTCGTCPDAAPAGN